MATLITVPVSGLLRTFAPSIIRRAAILAALGCLVTSCGGGGAGSGVSTPPAAVTPTPPPSPSTSGSGAYPYSPGIFLPFASFAAQCAAPRTGNDPRTGQPWPDRQGSVLAENHWLRAWTHDLYLWFDEVVDRDPAATPTTAAFFDLQKTTAVLPTGQAKDRFHFTASTADWLDRAESGIEPGYGVDWTVVVAKPPRRVVARFVQQDSPASRARLGRGAEITAIDGVDLVNDNTAAGVATLNAALFPATAGQSHQFTLKDRGASTTRVVALTSVAVTRAPVPLAKSIDTNSGRIGYLLFNEHVATAEQALIDAVTQLKAAAVKDLVLDIRYNGGGYLGIANELAYMIAGGARTAGRIFERIQFNSQHPATDPVTGKAIVADPFYTLTQGYGRLPAGQPLPELGLPRLYVLTSPATCSASESILNALRGIGVEIVQVGGDTCGKPYGFYPEDNCGTTYFSIQFRGVNDSGFGDYLEGFSATRKLGAAQANLPGCGTADDFSHELGDAAEGQLAAALAYRSGASCPVVTAGQQAAAAPGGLALVPPARPWRENRILR